MIVRQTHPQTPDGKGLLGILKDPSGALAVVMAFAIYLAFSIWMVSPTPPVGFYWDDAWYLFMAEWISGNPEHQALAWSMLRVRQYPPLFSFLIDFVGSGLDDQRAAFIANVSLLVLGTCIAMLWFRLERFSITATAIGSTFIILNPIALFFIPTLFSEHLYICLSTLAIYLSFRAKDHALIWLLVGIVAGLTVATRTAGLALVAGFFIYLASNLKIRQTPPFVAGLILGLLPILLFKAGLPEARSYTSEIVKTITSFDWPFLQQQFQAIIAGWENLWGSEVAALLFGVLFLTGTAIRAYHRKPDAFYVIAFFGMIAVWPYPDHFDRFFWTLTPVFVVAAHGSLAHFSKIRNMEWLPALTFLVIFTLTIEIGIGRTVLRLTEPVPENVQYLSRLSKWIRANNSQYGLEVLKTADQFLIDMDRIEELTEPGSCIYTELPAMVAVNTKRFSVASPWNSIQEISPENLVCQYYYLIPETLPKLDFENLDTFGDQHLELFRSPTPYIKPNPSPLGIFYKLQTTSSESN